MRFSAQADRDSFIEASNSINDMGIKFDTFIFRVTQFTVGGKDRKVLLLERFFGFDGICLGSEAGMARDEAEHSDGDIFGFGRSEHFLNHLSIRILPVRMQYARVNSETDTVAVILTKTSSFNSLVEAGSVQFVLPDCLVAVDAPGNDRLIIRFNGKQIVYICAFGEQHKICVWQTREELDKLRCKISNVVKGKRVEHFAHIEAYFSSQQPGVGELSDLLKHCVVVDIDFYKWVVFAINKRKITVRAAIRTTIGNWNEFVIRPAANTKAELPVKFINERICLTNHQSSFTFDKRLTERMSGGRGISLTADSFDLSGGKKLNNPLCFAGLGDSIPKQNRIRFEFSGCIHKHYYFN